MPRSGSTGRNFVYGPVPSRRLGYSLGVDIIPFKACTLDCIYCQLGPTARTVLRRRDFVPVRKVLVQVAEALRSAEHIDTITFSGSGEPTLNKSIGKIIRGIKRMTPIPVAVLTNATLLYRRSVRRDLLGADLVVPSLDGATAELFRRVNRPNVSLDFNLLIKGLADFRREFKGKIWLEIMLIRGINDSPAHIRKLTKVISVLKPDRIHLNTVVRPPAEPEAGPVSRARLENIRKTLGEQCEIVPDFSENTQKRTVKNLEASILSMVNRRPVTPKDIAFSTGRPAGEVRKAVSRLLDSQKIRRVNFRRKSYYEPKK